MGWGWDDNRDAHQEVYQNDIQPHDAKFSHELIGGAAAFEGMKLWEDHQRKEGVEVKHAFAKEMLMGFVGAEADKLAETKGMDFADRERAKHHAKQSAERMYDDQYGGQGDNWNPDQQQPNYNY